MNEQLLICGYVRSMYSGYVPLDIINTIILLSPSLYGARYDVAEHNVDLDDKIAFQLQNAHSGVFVINNINFHLTYDGNYGEYNLNLDFANQQTIKKMVIFIRLYCKNTEQSYSFSRVF